MKSRFGTNNHEYKHGHSSKSGHSSEYGIWANMKTRCLNPNNRAFKWYGERGIGICDRWVGSFEIFLADMGPRPERKTLERRDNSLGYSPDNCYWATWIEQQNNRCSNTIIAIGGAAHTIAEWSRLSGIRQNQISYRLKAGWPIDRLLTPVHPGRSANGKLREARKRLAIEGQMRFGAAS